MDLNDPQLVFRAGVAAGLLALLAVGLAVAALVSARRSRRAMEARLEGVERDLRGLVSAAVGVGERVFRLDRQLNRVSERQDELDQSEPANQAFQQAIRMAQRGSSVDDLVDICGLTRGEAELVAMLHRLDDGH